MHNTHKHMDGNPSTCHYEHFKVIDRGARCDTTMSNNHANEETVINNDFKNFTHQTPKNCNKNKRKYGERIARSRCPFRFQKSLKFRQFQSRLRFFSKNSQKSLIFSNFDKNEFKMNKLKRIGQNSKKSRKSLQ